MTYLHFHLSFNLPVLLLLLFLARRRFHPAFWGALGLTALIALAAATPWDNWAVHQGIWGFDWARVTPIEIPFAGTLWRLPAEEYAFFVIETLIVGLLVLLTLPAPRPAGETGSREPRR